jgi:hypothetical protein
VRFSFLAFRNHKDFRWKEGTYPKGNCCTAFTFAWFYFLA